MLKKKKTGSKGRRPKPNSLASLLKCPKGPALTVSRRASDNIINRDSAFASPAQKRWQLQEAKAKFSEVFEKALNDGPQYVTRRDKDEVVVVRRSDYEQEIRQPVHIVDILLAAPRVPDFIIDRDTSTGREPPEFS